MTDEEKIDAVTSKLTGKFYVGQRVRFRPWVGSLAGKVVIYCGPCLHNDNVLIEFNNGERWDVNPISIEPAL